MMKWFKFIIISIFITLLSVTSAIVIKNMSFNDTRKLNNDLFVSVYNHDKIIEEIKAEVDNKELFLINSVFYLDLNNDSSIKNISISCETENGKHIDLTKNNKKINMLLSSVDTPNYELITLKQYLECCSALYAKYNTDISIRSEFQLAKFVNASDDEPILLYEKGVFTKINYKIEGSFLKYDIFRQDGRVECTYMKY